MAEGNGRNGLMGLADKLIAALPPTFIMLCGINLVFLWLVMHFVGDQMDTRMALLSKVIEHCEK